VDFVRAELKAGGDLPLIPPMTVNAGLSGVAGAWDGRIQAQYGARQDNVAAFEAETPSYLTLDASIGYEVTPGVKLMFEADNITDEEVRIHASPLKEIAPQPGRNFKAAIRVSF